MHIKEETVLHFVGIGGIGMSGIAEVFLNQGYRITGSDLAESDTTRRLTSLGAKIHLGHGADNVHGSHVVVVSSAIRKTNPELVEAKRLRIPVIPRAEMLGELMRGKTGIAVAGTHGKTTTTSMLATVLTVAGLDPTLVIGGKVDSFGGNAKLGQGKYVVAEADESDGSFLHLPATYGIVTNIDNDHLDHFGNLTAIEDAFLNFVGKLPFYGLAVVCGEDAGVKRCLSRWTKPIFTYGFSEEFNLYATQVTCEGLQSRFKVFFREDLEQPSRELGTVQLSVPGQHNVLNALASIAIALKLNISFDLITRGLKAFRGVKRRFDIRWQDEIQKRVIVDDYGHHPTEISATLSAARNYWKGRIVSVFQPHRYSRTLHCHDGFLSAFSNSDVVLMMDIYSAGEDAIPGVDAVSLVADLKKVARPQQEIIYSGDLKNTQKLLMELFSDGDLVICLGAGSITRLPELLMAEVAENPV
jgi:UDP-N-acetylmuramate--alanine ligase